MAHKKGVGSTDNGRDSNSKRLGVKLFGGQHAIPGNIILRQRGTKYHPGENVYMGRDHTLHAKIEGFVNFQKRRNNRTYVNILASETAVAVAATPVKAKAATPKAAASSPKKESKATVKAPPAVAPKAESKATAKATPATKDKLVKVEGIGPKVNELLNNAGILSFNDLANSTVEKLQGILAEAGSRYQMMNPTTWPQQAQLAADGKWDDLKTLQDKLDGGRIVDEQE